VINRLLSSRGSSRNRKLAATAPSITARHSRLPALGGRLTDSANFPRPVAHAAVPRYQRADTGSERSRYSGGNGLFPFRASGPIFLIESAGLYNQNQLIVNVNTAVNQNVSLVGSYMLNRALSNTDGVNTFPANQYDLRGEYAPAATDVRQRMSLGGSLNTRWNVRLSPLVTIESGPPFDITVGQDV
jgi:hypothetical protein